MDAVIGFTIAGCKEDEAASVPDTLAADATYQQALDKCDELIAYCDANASDMTAMVRVAIVDTRAQIVSGGAAGYAADKADIIEQINVFIAALAGM